MNVSIRTGISLVLALGASTHLAGMPAHAAEATVGKFPPLAVVQSVLQRGVSRDVVRAALGEPVGSGHARIPPAHVPQEIWYYEDIEIEDATAQGDYVRMDLRQRILLVFFDGDRVEGFLWTSNKGDAEAIRK